MSEEDEQKKIQEIMKTQKAEIESKKEKGKQDFIEKERIACKKHKEELSKKRPEEHKQMKAKNVEEDTEEDVICKIGVIVDDNLYTLDDSTHDLVIADTSCSEDGHVKNVRFKGKEGSTCESDLNTDSKEIDCGADTVELSTLTAKSVVQDITNEEELNDTVSAQDDDDLEIPLTQNVQSQKYLKYNPAENLDDDEYAESGDEEIDKADEVTEGMEIAERVEYEETEESQEGEESGESQEGEEAGESQEGEEAGESQESEEAGENEDECETR